MLKDVTNQFQGERMQSEKAKTNLLNDLMIKIAKMAQKYSCESLKLIDSLQTRLSNLAMSQDVMRL